MGQRFSVSQIAGLETRLSSLQTQLNTVTTPGDTSCIKVGQYVFAALCGPWLCNCAVSCFGFSCCCVVFLGECVRGCTLFPTGLVYPISGCGVLCAPGTAGGSSCIPCALACTSCYSRCNFCLGTTTVYSAQGHVGLQNACWPVTLWRRVC